MESSRSFASKDLGLRILSMSIGGNDSFGPVVGPKRSWSDGGDNCFLWHVQSRNPCSTTRSVFSLVAHSLALYFLPLNFRLTIRGHFKQTQLRSVLMISIHTISSWGSQIPEPLLRFTWICNLKVSNLPRAGPTLHRLSFLQLAVVLLRDSKNGDLAMCFVQSARCEADCNEQASASPWKGRRRQPSPCERATSPETQLTSISLRRPLSLYISLCVAWHAKQRHDVTWFHVQDVCSSTFDRGHTEGGCSDEATEPPKVRQARTIAIIIITMTVAIAITGTRTIASTITITITAAARPVSSVVGTGITAYIYIYNMIYYNTIWYNIIWSNVM